MDICQVDNGLCSKYREGVYYFSVLQVSSVRALYGNWGFLGKCKGGGGLSVDKLETFHLSE